jgi:hypothetical protein
VRLAIPLLFALALPALASEEVAGLRFSVPKGWQRMRPSSLLFAAQFRIPRARHDKEDGELVLFQFEDEKGGPVSDIVERWYAQFSQPDGRASKEAAVVTTRAVNRLTVKTIDLSGSYRPQMGPMEHVSKAGYRLLAAVVDGDGERWYWRAVGPAKTIEDAQKGFDTLIDSLEVAR